MNQKKMEYLNTPVCNGVSKVVADHDDLSTQSRHILGWFKNPISSQTEKLMAGTKFSDYLGLNHYKKAKK